MTWIQGYNPDWVEDREKAEALVHAFASQWIGKTIDASYVGWYTPDDEWYEDFPIILEIGGSQFEICWQKFDSLSITKNQINLEKCVSYGEIIPYKKDALPPLREAIGKRIKSVRLGMSPMTFEDKVLPMINSVDFELENGFLTVYNGLDENGISNVPANV